MVNHFDFVVNDPISIPKAYRKKQDIEITAFWTSMLSWGQRKTIINKCNELFKLMDNAPHDFIVNHTEKDRKHFEHFKHRTFQYTDTLYFLEFLQTYFRKHDSLEDAFINEKGIENALIQFNELFFSLPDAPRRTQKHIASPAKKSTCKRLNMFLRWMVRNDNSNVDFGLWQKINSSTLMIPLDVHVERVARKLGLLNRKQRDWKAVVELTNNLKEFDPNDPVKYDYALFGMGVIGEM
ncbi:MAG: TIGR02757 family protein [Saprospiraceae bacterium]|nr:TIGR02757 family protein [Bacteroidia bacterium]NNE15143.1 TIGR02757 family protein [Saprospiraceae bacterium]NNL92978.1 TIGR02757 family protein [Saprospiraceae bacterium]